MDKWNENNIEGVEFTHKDETDLIYTITNVNNGTCLLNWVNRQREAKNTQYSTSDVFKYFKGGEWIPLTQPANEEIIFSLY